LLELGNSSSQPSALQKSGGIKCSFSRLNHLKSPFPETAAPARN
jgi:hypothetical protein